MGQDDDAVSVPPGKTLTDRKIQLKAVVAAPVEEIYRRWTTADGVATFFAHEAEIDARVGGRYHIYFMPKEHPESLANSSYGAKILALENNRRISFEWTTPPFAAEKNKGVLPLWVEVTLTPLESAPGHTIVELVNYGYGRSEEWDKVYEFFSTAWSEILYRLDRTVVDSSFVHSW